MLSHVLGVGCESDGRKGVVGRVGRPVLMFFWG